MKAYSYIRFSRPEQLKGDSLRRQMEASKRYTDEHGLALDDSLRDLGLSAFRGAHRTRGALGAFLALVEKGDIPPGSALIVESLDRLSREAVLEALEQFSGIIRAGITIITLSDGQTYSRETIAADWTKLLISLTIMSRAHEESAVKAQRLEAAWGNKRKLATAEGKAMTARCPAWLRLAGGRYVLDEARAAIIRRIFEASIAGTGKHLLARQLNADRVPPLGRAHHWQVSYISKILSNPATYGIGQPHHKVNGKRVPAGEPIAGYYPAVITEDTYLLAQASREARTGRGGRRGADYANILAGLCRCPACGGGMATVSKGPGGGQRHIVCNTVRVGGDCNNTRRWNHADVETLSLNRLTRIDLTTVLDQDNDEAPLVSAVATEKARLTDAERRHKRILAAIEDAEEEDPDAKARLRDLAATIKEAKVTLRAAEKALKAVQLAPTDLPARLATIADLTQQLATTQGAELFALRSRIAQELRRAVVRLEFGPSWITATYRTPDPKANRFALERGRGVYLHHELTDEEAAVGQDAEDWIGQRRPE